jgi:transketolase
MMTSEQLAWKIRRHGVEMTHLSGGSHLGAILSVADIMAVLYADVLNVDPMNPDDKNRDRFILSKGHAGAAVYAALAETGFFDVDELVTHYQNGSRLSGHVSHYVPGVDLSTGSLGHGLPVGVGMAYSALKDHKNFNVYVVLGDGECDEGSVWEAILFASHYGIKNITAIVDHNKMQSMDFCSKTLDLGNFESKWESFGWNVVSINGNDHNELRSAFDKKFDNDKPKVIIANTVKGFGIPFMENDILWHYRFPHDGWEYDLAVNELHKIKPIEVEDIYTPNGIENPTPVPDDADIYNDHTTTATWKPTWQIKEG